MTSASPPVRTRREPPPFRRVSVAAVTPLTPRLVRLTLAGPELEGFTVDQPAASVRLLLPPPGHGDVVLPAWQGNLFLYDDGSRPTIRTLTPLRVDPSAGQLDVEIVIHDGGPASAWALAARPGDPAAISGPARGYPVDPGASVFLLAGDESAIPAIGQLLEALPADRPVRIWIEVAEPSARLQLPEHPDARVEWLDLPPGAAPGEALVPAFTAAELAAGARVWAAGEAAAMQRIRRYLFEERQMTRSETWIRGYWKHGRAGDADDEG
jgi:NADPH-dependent ferric siderophore reductase